MVIAGCDSGATNTLLENGCTISDEIANLAGSARNHGQFVSGVAKLTNDLVASGLLGNPGKGRVQSCAARSRIP